MPSRFLFFELWHHFSARRKIECFLTIFLIVISSIAEVISISLLMPFIAVMTFTDFKGAGKVLDRALALLASDDIQYTMTLLFCGSVLATGVLRVTLLYVQTNFSYMAGYDLSIKMYSNMLSQPFSYFIRKNPNDIVTNFSMKAQHIIISCIQPFLNIVSILVTGAFILLTLLYFAPLLSLAIITILCGIYLAIYLVTKKKIARDSYGLNIESDNVIRAISNGVGAIRDIILDGSHRVFIEEFKRAELTLRKIGSDFHVISVVPRYVLEALTLLILAILIYYLIRFLGYEQSFVIPLVGVYLMGVVRILPLLQQGYAAFIAIRLGQETLKNVVEMLDMNVQAPMDSPAVEVSFVKSIELVGVCFSYGDQGETNSWKLQDINITISRGMRIGIMGKSGSGKSTLADIIMGLHPPSSGHMLVDGIEINNVNSRAWRRKVAHVPQNIYIPDLSVYENIALGIPKSKIDLELVQKACRMAQIADLVESWVDGYETSLRQGGMLLSGGQKQRIGLARAFYKGAELLILDEATSSLDEATETAVMESIDLVSRDITMIIIAHRLNTLKKCDRIFELANGAIVSHRQLIVM